MLDTLEQGMFSRRWAMPNARTFAIAPISEFLDRWIKGPVVVDPFAGQSTRGTHRNDLRADGTTAEWFLLSLKQGDVWADTVIFDPPYSARQISEHYKERGLPVSARTTQKPGRWTQEKDLAAEILRPGGAFIQCGWNSYGMGKGRGFRLRETLLVCHGAGHNDTIVIAETKLPAPLPAHKEPEK